MVNVIIRLLRKNHKFIYRWQGNLFPVACAAITIVGLSVISGRLPAVKLNFPSWIGFLLACSGILLILLSVIDTLYGLLMPFLSERRKATLQNRLADAERGNN